MALCYYSCVEQGDKEHNKKSNNSSSSVDLLPKGFVSNVKFNPALQKEMEEGGTRRSMTTQRQGGVTSTCVCAKDILEKK